MKIFAQFISSLIFSFSFGLLGLAIGAGIGAGYGFPDFGGNLGYEAGGAFMAIVGISLGALISSITIKTLQKQKIEIKIALISMIISLGFGLLTFDYYMPPIIGWSIFFLPSVLITVATNWKEIFVR